MKFCTYQALTSLHDAPGRGHDQHDLRDGEDPREGKERGEKEPLRHIGVSVGPEAEGIDRPDRHQHIGHEKQRCGIARHGHPLQGEGIPDQDTPHAEIHPDIPEQCAYDDQSAMQEPGLAQASHKPDGDGEGGIGRPAVEHGRIGGGPNPAVGQPFALTEKPRCVQLE